MFDGIMEIAMIMSVNTCVIGDENVEICKIARIW